jgi:hypothetical protein
MAKLNNIVVSIEILSDVQIEFSSFQSMLALLPHLLEDIEHAVDSVTSQTMHSSLLPTESIKKKIPQQTVVSLLTPVIKAFMTTQKSYIEFKLTEYMPAFEIHNIIALPVVDFIHNSDHYLDFDLQYDLVAINNQHETFIYEPGVCVENHGYNICPPQNIEIHLQPRYCAEALLQLSRDNLKICLQDMLISKNMNFQRYIFTQGLSRIRLFSPFKDTASTLCGSNFTKDVVQIQIGYTDIATNSECTVYTSQMKILSPVPPADDTEIKVDFFVPNMTMIMDTLMNEIEIVHAMNLSTLFEDMKTFDKDVLEEQTRITDVQTSLDKIKTIKELHEFDLLKVNLQEIHQPGEQMKLFFWGGLSTTFIIICILLYVCFPAACTNIIGIFIKAVWFTIKCLFGWLFKLLPKPETLRGLVTNQRPIPLEDSVSYSEDNIQLRRRNNTGILNTQRNRPRSTIDLSGPNYDLDTETARRPPSRSASFNSVRRNLLSELIDADLNINTESNEFQASKPSAPSSPNSGGPDYNWNIFSRGETRLLLQCRINGQQLTYVPENRQVYTHIGTCVKEPLPPMEMISEYMRKWFQVPETTLNDMKVLHPEWKFNRSMGAFYEECRGIIIYHFGYRVKLF